MTPEEAAVLEKIGLDVVKNFVAIVNKTFLFTIYSILVVKAGFILLHRDRRRAWSSILTMTAIIIMYSIATVLWTLDFTNFIKEAKITLIDDQDVSIQTKYSNATSFIFRLADAEDALYSYSSLLGDAIIIWRVYVLTPYNRRWIVIIPCAVLLGSLISTLMLTFCVARLGSDIVLGTFQKPAFCRNVQTVTYSMAFATTTIATICIGMTTWHYRKAISPSLSTSTFGSSSSSESDRSGTRRRRRQSPGERILILLLESGILYFLFFAVQLIADVPQVHTWISRHSGLSFSFVMYSYCSSIIVGIYPTAVIVLAHSKHAVIDAAAMEDESTFQAASMRFQNSTASTSVTFDPKPFGSGGASAGLKQARHHQVGFDDDDVELSPTNAKVTEMGGGRNLKVDEEDAGLAC